jgi:hypothetical protein
MWDATAVFLQLCALVDNLSVDSHIERQRLRSVESHISRKTSEIPGFPVRSASQVPRVRLSLRKAA